MSQRKEYVFTIGSIRKDVLERRKSTRSEAFFLLMSVDFTKFPLLSIFANMKTYSRKNLVKLPPKNGNSLLPIIMRRRLYNVFA